MASGTEELHFQLHLILILLILILSVLNSNVKFEFNVKSPHVASGQKLDGTAVALMTFVTSSFDFMSQFQLSSFPLYSPSDWLSVPQTASSPYSGLWHSLFPLPVAPFPLIFLHFAPGQHQGLISSVSSQRNRSYVVI